MTQRKKYYSIIIRYDLLELLTEKSRETIQTWFWRNEKSVLDDNDFKTYLLKYIKNEK